MPTSVTMPRLGETVSEGTIATWLKQEGDLVERDESLAEIVTDKINAELPSPVAGRLTKILVKVDETVSVGTEIAVIEEVGAQSVPVAPQVAPVLHAISANGMAPSPVQNGVHEQKGTGVATTATVVIEPEHPVLPAQNGADERTRISPLARRLAREQGVDPGVVVGTGVGGRVRKEDILAYVAQRQNVPATTVAPPYVSREEPVRLPETRPEPVASGAPDEEILVPSRMRLAIAEHMVRSKRVSPHATTVIEVDMTMIARWLAKNKEEFKRREGYSMSFVPFVLKAVSEGIRKFPLVNSSWTENNQIIIKKRINLGVAVSTDIGLVVPTIHDADQLTLAGLARQVNALAQRARANKLTVQDLQGSTFVVTNPGVFGTLISMPIINQPHAGILSMDAVVKRPVVIEDDAIAVRSMMYMSVSFDHRIIDGAEAGGFLQVVRTKLQSYGRDIDVY